jgi:hypothetical protein
LSPLDPTIMAIALVVCGFVIGAIVGVAGLYGRVYLEAGVIRDLFAGQINLMQEYVSRFDATLRGVDQRIEGMAKNVGEEANARHTAALKEVRNEVLDLRRQVKSRANTEREDAANATLRLDGIVTMLGTLNQQERIILSRVAPESVYSPSQAKLRALEQSITASRIWQYLINYAHEQTFVGLVDEMVRIEAEYPDGNETATTTAGESTTIDVPVSISTNGRTDSAHEPVDAKPSGSSPRN